MRVQPVMLADEVTSEHPMGWGETFATSLIPAGVMNGATRLPARGFVQIRSWLTKKDGTRRYHANSPVVQGTADQLEAIGLLFLRLSATVRQYEEADHGLAPEQEGTPA